jgi:uroporphyrin-III C-methyltransferase/precorrin-2 dehydrogenase/sirohydrochlorin ferrochelatase
VTLLGAGPGDPELLTLKGLRLLQAADIVFYDNLANRELLDYARRDAEKVYVGKKRAFAGIRQDEINRLLVDEARKGRQVVRLKGGDPFIFGRGGEEIAALVAEGVDFLVVPGISAALGAASYAGIPLTHREAAQSVRFVTGHRAQDRINLDWPELARRDQTLVIYMGLPGLGDICRNLIAHGLDPRTPAALVEKATLPAQQVVVAEAATLADAVAAAGVKGPTLIIIGDVVAYRVQTSGGSGSA